MFRSLKSILKERIKQYTYADEILAAEVLKLWQESIKEELGPGFVDKARALYLVDGILAIEISHSDLLKELRPREADFIKKTNIFLQRNFISPQKLKKIIYKISD